ncbi:DUF2934 domain-containing protein [Hansschlegelia beijingensis]|uniref:DUF2934 domain-containing protein n=1 Tax=Hansschlegelia beijingensis TaxID=1133344 RepID=A0A7W6GGV7_9HYPH|nr:DUF2934 domain-containing protein [Hansschlegelia beijingensis]MBB3974735.1 hypothetical protein [Hansschlegelia beijingensis]
MDPKIENIRERAHEIWLSEGRPEGRHDQHWAQAESELSGGSSWPSVSAAAVPPPEDPQSKANEAEADPSAGAPGENQPS